jgi:exosortase/archaeosortase family protein
VILARNPWTPEVASPHPANRLRRHMRGWSLRDADLLLAYSLAITLAAGINAGIVLALAAIGSVVLSERTSIRLSIVDYVVLSLVSLLFLPPSPHNLPFLGATIAGLYFWLFRSDCSALVSTGQFWLAISAYEAWGRVFFRLVSVPVLWLETTVIANVGQAIGLGLSVDGELIRSPNGWSVYILEACSSFHNVSLAVLVWLSLLTLAGASIGRSKIVALAVGAILIVALNVSRILLMTLSETQYEYWHHGNGAGVFTCLTLAAIALPTLRSTRRTGEGPVPVTAPSR